MATLTAARPSVLPESPAAVVRFLEDVLDEMALIDRAYHHLNLSIPLTAAILGRLALCARAGDRVLMIGGTALLGEACLRLGYNLEVWRLPGSFLSESVESHVIADLTPDAVGAHDQIPGVYSAIIAPLVMEGLSATAESFMRRAKVGLVAGGRVLLATRNQTRMRVRFAALRGKPLIAASSGVSLSWPPVPVLREYHVQDLLDAATRAGLHAHHWQYVSAGRALFGLEPLSVQTYGAKKAAQLVRHLLPPLRDTLLLDIGSRTGEAEASHDAGHDIDASVVVSATDTNRLNAVLGTLRTQTHPLARWEAIVMHDGRDDEIARTIVDAAATSPFCLRQLITPYPEGPRARNQATECARGQWTAHIDDRCRLRDDWLAAAMTRPDDDAAIIAGPIFALPGSEPKFLEVPGSRSDRYLTRRRIDPEQLYPIGNVFYRTALANAAGGFRESLAAPSSEPAAGWDTELAWRLQSMGWQVSFREDVVAYRHYPGPPRSLLKHQMQKARDLPRLYASAPALARGLPVGVFAARETLYFDLMLAGAAIALKRRSLKPLLAAAPWLRLALGRVQVWPPSEWRQSARMVAKQGALHAVWLAGLVQGSIMARRPVL